MITLEQAASFVTHLSTLRLCLIEANQAGDEEHDQKKLDEQKEQAQEMRRRNLRGWRLAACKQVRKHHGMEECLRILDAIPLNVHSGDESAHVGGTNKYQVLHQRWRNPSLRLFFKFLDWLHLAHRFGGTHRAGRGAFPRWRVRSQKVDPADAPPGLPKNFYCPSYLASLDEGDLKLLKVQPPVELAIPAEIFRLAARYRRVTSRKDGKKIIAPNDPILPPQGQDFYPLATTI
ncbi:hypothetical protein NLJ89_g10811 [Agrocybe chaxingu]|uniref:Uncharacterized protein n=1 Tax=Agrocybe chaxingu TaxID=84603 RepID=A0A9W8MQJ8_9AGAR|nr:hypothetical protein NLJ89_g10811 [Agrocybe chaxingu]